MDRQKKISLIVIILFLVFYGYRENWETKCKDFNGNWIPCK